METSLLIWDLHHGRVKLKTLNQLNGRNHTMSQNKPRPSAYALYSLNTKFLSAFTTIQ